jgi:glucose-6-phosphate 1-dehydrogenase
MTRPARCATWYHLFLLLSLIAMEPPTHFNAHKLRSEKDKVLAAI